MDDLSKIDKFEWYGIDGGYWYAGEKIDADDDPSAFWTLGHEKWFEAKDQMMYEVGQRQQKNEQDFELGSNYGREMGWYSDTFGDSFSDPYDY